MRRRNVALTSSAAIAAASAGIAWVLAKRRRGQTPSEIEPLPEDRAFDREKNIEYLKENYPAREYEQPEQPSTPPTEVPQTIEKDKPLRGFHGG